MAKFLKIAAFILALLGGLELIARLAPHAVPVEIHQDYSAASPLTPGYHPFTNGRGARGHWPERGQTSVALFGSSIAEQRALPLAETWPARIEEKFGHRLRIDNYAAGSIKAHGIEDIVGDLVSRGIQYDYVILHMTVFPFDRGYARPLMYNGSYYERFIGAEGSLCYFCHYARETAGSLLTLSLGTETLQRGQRQLQKFFRADAAPTAPAWPPHGRRYNRRDFNRLREEGRLVRYLPPPLPPDYAGSIHKTTGRLIRDLHRLSPHIIWIPELAFYSPRMKESYIRSFVTVLPIADDGSGVLGYHDEQSLYHRFWNRYREMAPVVAHYGVPEVRWYDEYSRRMETEEGLNSDEYHLTAKGAAAFADILYPQLRGLIRLRDR